MSLLSDFLGTTDFSLSDSPMFRELIKNIVENEIYFNDNIEEFLYDNITEKRRYDFEIMNLIGDSNLGGEKKSIGYYSYDECSSLDSNIERYKYSENYKQDMKYTMDLEVAA